MDFLVDHSGQLGNFGSVCGDGRGIRQRVGRRLPPPSLRPSGAGFQRGSVRYPVQPPGQPIPIANGGRFANEDEEGRLKSVVSVRAVTKHPPADAEDGRPVASDKQSERGLVPAGDEPIEQQGVARPVGGAGGPGGQSN
jgi:hypothetical protein